MFLPRLLIHYSSFIYLCRDNCNQLGSCGFCDEKGWIGAKRETKKKQCWSREKKAFLGWVRLQTSAWSVEQWFPVSPCRLVNALAITQRWSEAGAKRHFSSRLTGQFSVSHAALPTPPQATWLSCSISSPYGQHSAAL